jgi:hypothetical protein
MVMVACSRHDLDLRPSPACTGASASTSGAFTGSGAPSSQRPADHEAGQIRHHRQEAVGAGEAWLVSDYWNMSSCSVSELAYAFRRCWTTARCLGPAHTERLHREARMCNPWLKKNPYLSMWLSGVNAVVGAAQGRARNTAKRKAAAATRQMTEAMVNAWLMPLTASKPRRKKRR